MNSQNQLKYNSIPLGLKPTISMDIASEVRRAYAYQTAAGVTLICDALKRDNYKEFWFEHHDDIIGVNHSGKYDIFQVKTRESTKKWTLRDKEIVKAITKFGKLENDFGRHIQNYFIYSNTPPYIPSESSPPSPKQQISLVSLREAIDSSTNKDEALSSIEELEKLSKSIGQTISITRSIIFKLEFIKGRSLEDFREGLAADLFSLPLLDGLSISKLQKLGNLIFQRVEQASTLDLPGLDILTSITSPAGLPSRLIENKCVTINAVRALLDEETRRNRRSYHLKIGSAVSILIICTAFTGLFFYKPDSETLLEKSLRVVHSARNASLPPTFAESISAIRAAKLPLDGMDLSGATLRCQDMSKLNLSRINGQSMHATGAKFLESQLYMADFSQSELNASSYARVTADSAIFDNSNMLSTDFSDSIVRWASFKNVTLNGSEFSRSDLSQSDFTDADLTLTELQNTNLSGAKFNNAKLDKSNISGANFKGAIGLTQSMLNVACVDSSPPTLDFDLKAPITKCFTDDDSKAKRAVMQQVYAVIGQMAVLGGYCKEGQFIPRAPDGHGHIEQELPFFIPLRPKD